MLNKNVVTDPDLYFAVILANSEELDIDIELFIKKFGEMPFYQIKGDCTYIVSRSFVSPGHWRVSFIDQFGPVCHQEYSSYSKSVRRAFIENKLHFDKIVPQIHSPGTTFNNSHSHLSEV